MDPLRLRVPEHLSSAKMGSACSDGAIITALLKTNVASSQVRDANPKNVGLTAARKWDYKHRRLLQLFTI